MPPAQPTTAVPPSGITLRTRGGHRFAFKCADAVLYPLAVSWNRLLVADRFRAAGDAASAGRARIADDREPRARGSLRELVGGTAWRRLEDLLDAAVEAGVLQVETDWRGDATGYAARIFPWEEIITLATRGRRRRTGQRLVVVRWLRGLDRPAAVGAGPALVVATEDAAAADFAVGTESLIVRRTLARAGLDPGPGGDRGAVLTVDSDRALERRMAAAPAVVHFMLRSVDRGLVYTAAEQRAIEERDPRSPVPRRRPRRPYDRAPALADLFGAGRPAIVSFSSCYTGRRLAPRTVAAGAGLSIGFHQEVDDTSLPGFFAALYERLLADGDAVAAMAAALDFNRDQPDHDGLGAVTVWSDRDLLARPAAGRGRMPAVAAAPPPHEPAPQPLLFDCEVEAALNYSVLHNSRGGLFRRFVVTRLAPAADEPLAIGVRLDTGAGQPAECRFLEPAPASPGSRGDLSRLVSLPLGAELLRQRREATRATVEVVVEQAGRRLLHVTRPVLLLPCDEWRDDRAGRHFLPSFIFPRDPAVRTILSAAAAHLRAIADDHAAAFDGYQRAADGGSHDARPVDAQAQAIWWAAQEGFGIDYAEPPPTYTAASQRLRTPEEILRGRRATCIELALLLASCLEHVGLQPVIVLTRGHALCGYWASPQARDRFRDDVAAGDPPPEGDRPAGHRGPNGHRAPTGDRLGGVTSRRDVSEPWMLAEPWHLERIVAAIAERRLVPVEATALARQQGFRAAVGQARDVLTRLAADDFDGMLDVQSARVAGVTPLPILTDGILA